jgi:CHASE3 domain sensor protein
MNPTIILVSLAIVVVIAYYVSLWDVARMRRNARKHSEHKHLIELLKR